MGTAEGQHAAAGRATGLRVAVLVVSALVGLTALWGLFDAAGREPRVWGWFGFEVVTLVAAALGVLIGVGRPREAPALAVACVAGSVFAAATLGRFSAIVTRAGDAISEGEAVRLLIRDPFYDARLLAVLVLGVVALVFALGRDAKAWVRLLIGAVSAAPVLAATGWVLGPGKDVLLAPVEDAGDMARLVGSVLGVIVLIVLASLSVHLIVSAFESRLDPLPGRTRRRDRSERAEGTAPAKA